jgi:hypothetical protein
VDRPGERRLIVDRFEGDLVVVGDEGGRLLDLPRWLLPAGLREGDVVAVRGEGEGSGARVELRVDREASAAARAEAAELLARLGHGT